MMSDTRNAFRRAVTLIQWCALIPPPHYVYSTLLCFRNSLFVNDVKNEFKENVIRMAFVAYRDYTERQYRIQIFDFTEDVDAFTVALGNIRAYRGGDYPEDVLGGINATLGLNWQAANKLFFQIGKKKYPL